MCTCVVSVVCGINSLFNCTIIVRTVKEKREDTYKILQRGNFKLLKCEHVGNYRVQVDRGRNCLLSFRWASSFKFGIVDSCWQ